MKPALLIMAAGMASRYGGDLKQLDAVGTAGETIMEYSIYDALRTGFDDVVFVIRRSFEKQFCKLIINRLKKHVNVDYVFQELDMVPEGITYSPDRQKPWGAAQAVLAARNKIQVPFAVINADDFYGHNAFKIMWDYLSVQTGISTSFAMVGYELQKTLSDYGTVSRGICRLTANGYLTEVDEQPRVERIENSIVSYTGEGESVTIDGTTKVSMNFWGFTAVVFNLIGNHFHQFLLNHSRELKSEYTLPTAVDHIMKAGEATVKLLPCNEQWFGVTYKKDKPAVMQNLRNLTINGKYPERLWGS